jgi:hypothetical protein
MLSGLPRSCAGGRHVPARIGAGWGGSLERGQRRAHRASVLDQTLNEHRLALDPREVG